MKVEICGLKSYLSPEGVSFKAGKVYDVKEEMAVELLSRCLPNGLPIFKTVSDGDIEQREAKLQEANATTVEVVTVDAEPVEDKPAPKKRGRRKKVETAEPAAPEPTGVQV